MKNFKNIMFVAIIYFYAKFAELSEKNIFTLHEVDKKSKQLDLTQFTPTRSGLSHFKSQNVNKLAPN